MSAPSVANLNRIGPRSRAGAPPVEYSLLLTATLCLVAFGIVMVFSASSTTSLLGTTGDSAYYLKRTLLFGGVGLLAMKALSGRGARAIRPLTPLLLAGSFFLLFMVLLPGFGISANGASRWIGAGPVQIQPSELAKLALILYGAQLLAERPRMTGSLRTLAPYLMMVGFACLLIVAEPDLGTAMVVVFATTAMLVAAGVRMRVLALLAAGIGVVVLLAIAVEPYRMQRLTGFLNPTADSSGAGFQAIQAKIALGSGGFFGVGLGQSLQKAFFLPEAHTDMIAAVIGEELGFAGLVTLVGLFGLFGYAGLRTAQRARPLRQAARRGAHLADPGPGADQPVRGARPGAPDRGAAAVRLLRQLEPHGHACRRGAAAGDCPAPGQLGGRRRCETARRPGRSLARERAGRHQEEDVERCQES